MVLPNFLIVGAAKTGTTSLYHYLKQHPDIYMPSSIKETFFLSGITSEMFPGVGHRYGKRMITELDEYLSLFKDVGSETAVGEACVAYLYFYQKSIPKIIEVLGEEVKIIICLRDPVDRAYSNYLHHVRDNLEDLPFSEAIKAESWRKEKGWWWGFEYLPVSYYYEQVKAYIDVFGRGKTLIILYEDLHQDSLEVMKNTFRFLKIDDSFTPDMSLKYNVSKNVARLPKNKAAQDLVSHLNPVKSIGKKFFPNFVRKLIGDRLKNINMTTLSEVSQQDRRKLVSLYQNDILQLQDLIGRDLSHWLE